MLSYLTACVKANPNPLVFAAVQTAKRVTPKHALAFALIAPLTFAGYQVGRLAVQAARYALPEAWYSLRHTAERAIAWARTKFLVTLLGGCEDTALISDPVQFALVRETATPAPGPLLKLPRKFRKIQQPIKARENHPHPAEAANRDAAMSMIVEFGKSSKLTPYAISSRSREKGMLGVSGVHSPFDAATALRSSALPANPLFVLIDVDYYVNMNELLAKGHPVILYTFSPNVPAGTAADTEWYPEDGQMTVKINGGVEYRHQLWNYATDELVIPASPGEHYVYRVDARALGLGRRLVMLTPVAHIVMPWWMRWIFNPPYRQRCLTRIPLQHPVRWTVSGQEAIVLPGDRRSYVTSVDALNSIQLRNVKQIRVSEVQAFLRAHSQENPLVEGRYEPELVAPRVHALLGLTDPGPRTDVQASQLDPIPDAASVPLTKVIDGVSPLAAGAVTHTKGLNAERACLEGRLEQVRNDSVEVPDEIVGFIAEFVHLAKPSAPLRPYDYCEVLAVQNRRSQRETLANVLPVYGIKPVTVKAFIKGEAYAKPTTERNISTVPPDQRTEFSRYTLPLAKFLAASTRWYAFSRKPAELAQLLHERASTWKSVLENDFSKFDGSNGIVQAAVMLALYDVCFGPDDADEAKRLATAQIDPPAFTAKGIAYSPGFSTLSGGPDTSLRNTVNCAFLEYVARRLAGMPPGVAWSQLGIMGGDDSVADGAIADWIPRAGKMLGLTCKPVVVEPGAPMTFLGRVYPNIWAGPESFSDPARHLPKLHLTSERDPNVHPNDIARRKAEGFMATDPLTPLLSDWATWVLRELPAKGTKTNSGASWWARAVAEGGPFPQLPYEEAIPFVAARLGLTSDLLEDMIAQVRKTGKVTNVLDLSQPASVVGTVMVSAGEVDTLVTGPAIKPPQAPCGKTRNQRRAAARKVARKARAPSKKLDADTGPNSVQHFKPKPNVPSLSSIPAKPTTRRAEKAPARSPPKK
nr:MAG: RNA-dependent RNA polymerase [Crogonang virus 50]